MVAKDLLDILCCPETKQELTLIEGEIIEKINQKIQAGALKNRGGDYLKENIDFGLLREAAPAKAGLPWPLRQGRFLPSP